MKRNIALVLALALLCLGIACLSRADNLTQIGAGGGDKASSGGGCTAATNFIARTTGLTTPQQTAYTTMICSLVSSGDWANLDAFYMYVTNTTATLKLNLVSTSFTLTLNGAGCTFTAFGGYQGDASTCYQDSGFNPSTAGGHYTLNSSHIGVCDLTARTTANINAWAIGSFDSTNVAGISLINATGDDVWYVNQTSSDATLGFSSTQGMTSIFRTAATSGGNGIILNGVFVASGTVVSAALPNFDIDIMTLGSSSPLPNTSPDNFGYAWWGNGSVNALNIFNAAHTFISTVSGPSGC